MENLIASSNIVLISHFIILLGFLSLLILMTKKIVTKLKPISDVTKQPWIISIGLTSFLFSKTLFTIVIQPVSILISNIAYLFTPTSATGGNSTKELSLNDLAKPIIKYFENFPIGNTLMLISCGIIIFRFTAYCFKQLDDSKSQQPPQGENAFLYNLITISVLVFSLFLVVSVFISIPYLNEIKKPSFFTRGGLDTTLNSIRLSDSNALRKDISESPFSMISIRDSLIKDAQTGRQYSKLPESIQKEFDQVMSSIDNDINTINRQRKELKATISNTIEQFIREKPAKKEELVRNYERFMQSNSVDKDLLFTVSVNAYQDYIKRVRNSVNQSYTQILQTDDENLNEYHRLNVKIKDALGSFFNPTDSSYKGSSIPFIDAHFANYYNEILSILIDFNTSIPVLKRDGSDWGFFGATAKFLIKTESLELVLLIGMLGFGLLGASISSFQSPKNDTISHPNISFITFFKTKPIINDFWNILVRGFSAAIVIYLATKGGITILTGDIKNDPNGYVLLLMCFVGAVYSEKVWDKIKKKALDDDNKSDSGSTTPLKGTNADTDADTDTDTIN